MLLPGTPFSNGALSEHVPGLHLVAYSDIKWLARLLLERGSDICASDSLRKDPLAWALEYNALSMTRLLLDSDVAIELKDNRGRTHLALAAMNGYRDIIDEPLKCRADMSVGGRFGQNTLSLAAICGHLPVVKLLLGTPNSEAGLPDGGGRTALYWAADRGHDDVVAYLAVQPSVDTNAQDNVRATPLITSARRGQIGVFKILLEQTRILNNIEDHSGRTALMWAVIEGQLEVLQLLLSRENLIKALKSTDYSGNLPLDWAIALNHVSVRELLSSRMKYEGNLNE